MHEDTLSLLGDCTAGIHMALGTMDQLLPQIGDRTLRKKLSEGKAEHQALHTQAKALLARYGGKDKSPSPMASSMAWLKTNGRMAFGGDDTTAAYLVADGCDMGIKSLSRSRNRNIGASQEAIDLAQNLIRCEARLSAGLRPFL